MEYVVECSLVGFITMVRDRKEIIAKNQRKSNNLSKTSSAESNVTATKKSKRKKPIFAKQVSRK